MHLAHLHLYDTLLIERKGIALLNSASPWASDEKDLTELYKSPHTSAVTTRTAVVTLADIAARGTDGATAWKSVFAENGGAHNHAFLRDTLPTLEGGRLNVARGSLNSYGYSPHPLSSYMGWIESLLQGEHVELGQQRKPFIISITGPPKAIEAAITDLRRWTVRTTGSQAKDTFSSLIGVELNLSCPNIKESDAPSGYDAAAITEYVVAAHNANTTALDAPRLAIGLKLPPYNYPAQFFAVIKALESVQIGNHDAEHPIAFLTSTNTLGCGFWLNEGDAGVLRKALPSVKLPGGTAFDGTGGLAGESLHPIALGNVLKLHSLLQASTDERLRRIHIIGVGGIASGLSVQRMLAVGAHVVALATALGREGIDVFERITHEILDSSRPVEYSDDDESGPSS